MTRPHGVTVETVKRFVIDAGAVYLDYGETTERLLGATRGGNSFIVTQEVRIPEIDGAKGPVKGSRRVIAVDAKINANLIEITADNILTVLPGAEKSDYPSSIGKTHDSIIRDTEIASTNYYTNVAIVGKVSGSDENFIGIIKNGLSDGNLEMALEERGEAVVAVQFTGHYTGADLDTEPWEIRFPVIVPEGS